MSSPGSARIGHDRCRDCGHCRGAADDEHVALPCGGVERDDPRDVHPAVGDIDVVHARLHAAFRESVVAHLERTGRVDDHVRMFGEERGPLAGIGDIDRRCASRRFGPAGGELRREARRRTLVAPGDDDLEVLVTRERAGDPAAEYAVSAEDDHRAPAHAGESTAAA